MDEKENKEAIGKLSDDSFFRKFSFFNGLPFFLNSFLKKAVHYLTLTEPEWVAFGFWFYIVTTEEFLSSMVGWREKPLKSIFSTGGTHLFLEDLPTKSWVRIPLSSLPDDVRVEEAISYCMIEWGKQQISNPSAFLNFHTKVGNLGCIKFRRNKDQPDFIEPYVTDEKGKEHLLCLPSFIAYELHMRYTGHTKAIQEVIESFSPYIRSKIIDIGCGPGSHAKLFVKALKNNSEKNGEIYFADKDPVMHIVAPHVSEVLLLDPKFEDTCGAFRYLQTDICETEHFSKLSNSFNTVVASYIWPWVSDRLDQVMQNIVNCLVLEGHFIAIGEFPDRPTPSLFRRYADLGKVSQAVPLETLSERAESFGLKLICQEEKEVITPEPENRHQMFGAVFKKI